MPAVSVIIPTYKHRDYVLQTLDSVFAQTFTDYEVIVINDGSPDDTIERLRPLVSAGRIRYIEQHNQGQATARNRGFAEARGEFITFLDDDDLWPVDKLQWQVDSLRQQPGAGAITGACVTIDGEGREIKRWHVPGTPVTAEALFGGIHIFSPGQVLIRAEAFRAIGGFSTIVWGADDFELWFDLVRTSLFLTADVVALKYRVHSANASRNLRRMLKGVSLMFDRQLKMAPTELRGEFRRKSDVFLYDYFGMQFVGQFKNAVRSHDLAGIARNGAGIACFLRRIRQTRPLAWKTLRELTPARLRRGRRS